MKKTAKIIILALMLVSEFSIEISESNAQVITWQRVLNYTNNANLYKAHQTNDKCYIAVGQNPIGIYNKIYLIKFNQFGDTLWSKYFDLNINSVYRGYWVEETSDKGFIISGSGAGLNSDAYLIKTDSAGDIIWYKTFGGFDLDQGRCVKQLDDKGYILLVRTLSFSSTEDILIIRTDSLGNKIWSKIYGDNSSIEYATEIQVVNNSGFILTGGKKIVNQPENLYLIRLDLNGDSLWSRTYYEYLFSVGNSIDITNDGGFIIGGICDTSFNNYKKAYIIKTDSLGILQWSRRYYTNHNEWCFSIRKLERSRYIFCGMSDSTYQGFERAIVRIIDKFGNIMIEKFFRPGIDQNVFQSVELTNDNGFILCGFADFGSAKAYIVKTDSLINVKPVGINNSTELINNFELYQNYPNPFNSETIIKYKVHKSGFIKISIFDISGKEVCIFLNENKLPGVYSYNFNANNYQLSSGIYFCKFSANNNNKEFLIKKLLYIK